MNDSSTDREADTHTSSNTVTYEDRVSGCLLGTMAGDAYAVLQASGDDPAAALQSPENLMVSDATQLTLYSVDGLVEALEWANDGVAADETACLWLAYLRWLMRQGEHLPSTAPAPPARWIDRQTDILPVHRPDADTVRALLTGAMGTQARPLNPGADGPGALMRSAPFGLVPRIPASMVRRLTTDAAALTHGSEDAKETAALLSGLIRALAIEGRNLDESLASVYPHEPLLTNDSGHGGAAGESPESAPTASGTFAAALQAAREGVCASSSPVGQLEAALAHATRTDRSDADSVIAASLAGGILGALHGTDALPSGYLSASGVAGLVRAMAQNLLDATTGS